MYGTEQKVGIGIHNSVAENSQRMSQVKLMTFNSLSGHATRLNIQQDYAKCERLPQRRIDVFMGCSSFHLYVHTKKTIEQTRAMEEAKQT